MSMYSCMCAHISINMYVLTASDQFKKSFSVLANLASRALLWKLFTCSLNFRMTYSVPQNAATQLKINYLFIFISFIYTKHELFVCNVVCRDVVLH